MANPLIVFFDTFTHIGQTQENTDCVRFKSGIQLLEIRILPFGSVIDSNLSDEALLGATNPASFDVTLYSNSQTNCITLHDIAKHHFDEKNGINSIILKEPVQSNLLLFRGKYSTLTVALFGLPTLPMNPPLHHATNLTVPPPQLTLTTQAPRVTTDAPAIYQKPTGAESSFTLNVVPTQKGVEASQLSWSQENLTDTRTDSGLQKPVADHDAGSGEVSGSNQEENSEHLKDLQSEVGGLYEDGEIQDIDYEEISSNEELFSEIDEGDYIEDGHQTIDLCNPTDPRLARSQWRFNPWQVIDSLASQDRLRIPDPCLTLFEMHCWLLERLDRDEPHTRTTEPSASSECQVADDETGEPRQLLPPPEDWSQAASSAQLLLSAAEKFPPGAVGVFDQMWVETMENIGTHLASGLAFLHRTDKSAYQMVNEALIIWVYTGLDMSAALRQSNSTYIVRHLMAGVNLVGLVTGTTSRLLAWSLLYPTGSETHLHSPELVVLQVQHRLLNLLESPLITTPLRLAICRSLDQTTRLSIGLDAFLGRPCPVPCPSKNSISRDSPDNTVDSKHVSSEPEELKPDSLSPLIREHKLADSSGTDDASDDKPATVATADIKDPLSADLGGQGTELKRTPYQRLVFLLSSTKNSRVTSAYERLLNKIHAYEMLLEFHNFLEQLRTANQFAIDADVVSSLRMENQLTYYLTQLTDLWRNAEEFIANPRSTLPCPMLLDTSQKHYHNPYPDLCTMLDSTHILDNVTWILEMLLTVDSCDQPSQISTDAVKREPEKLEASEKNCTKTFILSDAIANALMDFVRTLMAHSSGLTLLASRPESTGRLLDLCLNLTTRRTSAPCSTNACGEAPSDQMETAGFVIMGLELAHKLEALRCIDVLVAWARKKGVTGIHSTVAELREEFDESLIDKNKSGDPLEPMLRDALFSLARLPASALSTAPSSTIPSDWWDWISPVVTCSAPTWVAEVVAMDDHFVPLLMLLEALSDQDSLAAAAAATTTTNQLSIGTVKSSESLKETGETEKPTESSNSALSTTEPQNNTTFDIPTSGGIRTTLKQLLANPLDVSSLVTTIVLNLLRNGENATYLDRYGPRLALLVSPHNWEDVFEDPVALGMFTRLRTFNRSAAALFLAWLRECPARPPTAATPNLLCLPPPTPLSAEAFTWLTTQLKPLISELEEALDAVVAMETAEDLVQMSVNNTAATSASGGRKAPYNQSISFGRYLPSGLLVLLRLIRAHVCGVPTPRLCSAHSVTPIPEQQIVLGQTLALIELYSANGLQLVLSLVQKIADYFLLQLQATLYQSTCSSDLLGVSVFNTNTCMLLSILDNAVHVITQLLVTILHVRGDQFADLTPVRTLCMAYACALYTPSPPGVRADQLAQIRDVAVTGIMAYMGTNVQGSIKVEHLEKSLWVGACKEVITFTISAPMYYLAGVRLLLDLLPLPLPVFTLHRLNEADQQRMRAMRDAWALRIWSVSNQITGLVELLGATEPRQNNPLYVHVLALVRRLADMGVSCATALATACLDSLFSVWDELVAETAKKRKNELSDVTGETDSIDKPTSTGSDARPGGDVQSNTLSLRAPSSRLLLLTGAESNPLDAALLADCGKSSTDSETAGSRPSLPTTANPGALTEPFIELEDSTELTSALSLLYINLQVPACRYALLQLFRQGPTDSEDTAVNRSNKPHDDTVTSADIARNRTYGRQFCRLVNHILSPCSDKPSHVRTQLMLLKCLELLVDTELALKGFEPCPTPPVCDPIPSAQNELLHLSEGVFDLSLCPELILSLLRHVSHTDRDMSALPQALRPLLLLTQHDYGFRLVRDALDSPVAQIGGQHLFASLVQRVNDCFSTENPDCQTTLAVCLQLLQSMVVGRTSLPLTFTATVDEAPESTDVTVPVMDGNSFTNSLIRFRQLHISGNRVRAYLDWSGVGDEGKPVRDLHALLEMLADDEPSLEYLRTGMKNLLSLLSEEFEVSECDPTADRSMEQGQTPVNMDCLPALPEPRSLDRLFAERPYFVTLTDVISADQGKSAADRRRMLVAHRRLGAGTTPETSLMLPKSSEALTCNLAEMAYTCCNGLSIRDELLKCGRKRDSGDAAIRHQKRRRGQASIIETGRTSKKFVAPMRGRGFVLRGGVGSAGSSGASGAPHGSGPTASGSGGGRPDPFRSRPLNTSRPPSLHVDDFTKLVKEDNVIEELPRSRSYRDTRGFRGGRGSRMQSNRSGGGGGAGGQSGSLSTGPSLLPTLPLGLGVQPMNPLSAAAALLPSWNTDTRPISLLPFGLDSRSNQGRRDRSMR